MFWWKPEIWTSMCSILILRVGHRYNFKECLCKLYLEDPAKHVFRLSGYRSHKPGWWQRDGHQVLLQLWVWSFTRNVFGQKAKWQTPGHFLLTWDHSIIHLYSFFFRFSSVIGYYKILSIVPCAICSGSLLVMYFTYNSVYLLIPNSKFIPPPPFHFGNHMFVFCV